jgi:hypothetical protein
MVHGLHQVSYQGWQKMYWYSCVALHRVHGEHSMSEVPKAPLHRFEMYWSVLGQNSVHSFSTVSAVALHGEAAYCVSPMGVHGLQGFRWVCSHRTELFMKYPLGHGVLHAAHTAGALAVHADAR